MSARHSRQVQGGAVEYKKEGYGGRERKSHLQPLTASQYVQRRAKASGISNPRASTQLYDCRSCRESKIVRGVKRVEAIVVMLNDC